MSKYTFKCARVLKILADTASTTKLKDNFLQAVGTA
jgi:hypothetical protein